MTSVVGVLLTLPTLYFIFISVMKYVFGWDYLFDAATPTPEGLGIKESFGWNITLLILFGPVLALVIIEGYQQLTGLIGFSIILLRQSAIVQYTYRSANNLFI